MPPSLRCSSLWAAPSVSAHFDPHCAGRRPVRLGHGLLAGAGIRGRGASVGGRRPLSGSRSGRGHCDGAEQGHCLRRSGVPVLPVAAPTVSETFHSAVGSGRPAGQYGGGSAGLPTVFHAPHPSVGTAGGLCQRRSYLMAGMVGCPCTLVITGDLGRFVAPLCRREAVYDEDLLLRGLWKLCTANCPSADKPEKRSRYKRRLGTTSPQPPFFCPTTGRAGLTERTPAPPMRRR